MRFVAAARARFRIFRGPRLLFALLVAAASHASGAVVVVRALTSNTSGIVGNACITPASVTSFTNTQNVFYYASLNIANAQSGDTLAVNIVRPDGVTYFSRVYTGVGGSQCYSAAVNLNGTPFLGTWTFQAFYNQSATPAFTVSFTVTSASVITNQRLPVITTVAGSQPVFQGNGGPAANAVIGLTPGVATDSSGNVYFSDQSSCVVAKVAGGIVQIVAGNGVCGYSGDGGPATSAAMNQPDGVAIDAAGNLYIADALNCVIRKVTPSGIISTVAGQAGSFGFHGDGGPATSALLWFPFGVAVDSSGNLYIADSGNSRVRMVDTSGNISTLAGMNAVGYSGDNGPATLATLNSPQGIAVDAGGNIYVSDSGDNRVRMIAASGIITTFAGNGTLSSGGDGGPATSAGLLTPAGLAVDLAGNVYIAEYNGDRIRKVNTAGIITSVAGNQIAAFGGDGGVATSASLNQPYSVAVDTSGNLYVADFQNRRVRQVNAAGTITTLAGHPALGDGGPATRASLTSPYNMAADGNGNLFIADTRDNLVRKVDASGNISTYAGTGSPAYSGDAGPATSAGIGDPYGVTLDAAGNLYIADFLSSRVRRVTPAGVITTVAGTGQPGFSGDGGPATSAAMYLPERMAVDGAGNLYIVDYGNCRVRKVSASGTISTVAGDGQNNCVYSGDGVVAVATAMAPFDVAVDSAGNLFIADGINNRVLKVDASTGIVSTIAGTGTAGISGDNGPATSAQLNRPVGIALDSAGNLYIADSFNAEVRMVNASGIISTVAGNGAANFSGDGGPATGAELFTPSGVSLDPAGNLYIADASNNRVRKVLVPQASTPSLAVTPTSLSFTAPAGAGASMLQELLVASSVAGLPWSTVATVISPAPVTSGPGWLTVSPASGATPGAILVAVSAANLVAGAYTGSVQVISGLATPNTITIPITFTVTAALPSQLSVQPPAMVFKTIAGTNPLRQNLFISNPSGAFITWHTNVTTTSGGNWLTLSLAQSGTFSSASWATPVIVNAANLSPGTYQASIAVTSPSTGTSAAVPVTLLVAAAQPAPQLLLTQTALTFTAVAGSSAVPSQSFGVINSGAGAMSWTAAPTTFGGGNWLSVSPASGTSSANSTQIPTATVSVNTSSLAAGVYSGWVWVSTTGAVNSPQFVTVKLIVLPAGSNPGISVQPAGLIFAAVTGTSSPGSQVINVATANPAGSSYVGSVVSSTGWLTAAPLSAILSAGQAQQITVQPKLDGLSPGVYQGSITLQFADGSAQTVGVTFLVAAKASSIGAQSRFSAGLGACVPTKLIAQDRSVGGSANVSVGYGRSLEVEVYDDCGNLVNNAAVTASFSDGETVVPLSLVTTGIYSTLWKPTSAGAVTVTLTASAPGVSSATVAAYAQSAGNPTAPLIYTGGVVNGASFVKSAPLAPGSIVSIFGSNLSQAAQGSSALPLPSTLAGATVTIGGIDVPLFYSSSGQVNAQIPFELSSSGQTQVIVRTIATGATAPTVTVPETLNLAVAAPGIFTIASSGSGQGAILIANTATFAAPAGSIPGAPASPVPGGQYISIFCSGLGAVTNQPASGTAAGSNSTTVATPVVSIGGQNATVTFSGLAPGFVGLYQVNAQVPATVQSGNTVPVTLSVNGAVSNTVTIAVQ